MEDMTSDSEDDSTAPDDLSDETFQGFAAIGPFGMQGYEREHTVMRAKTRQGNTRAYTRD